MITILSWMNAVIGMGIGGYCLIWPKAAADALGIAFLHSTGLTDFRATYGGITLACGLFFLLAALRFVDSRAGLWFSVLFYAGLGITRGVGLLMDGSPQKPMMYWFFVIEIVFLLASVFLLVRSKNVI